MRFPFIFIHTTRVIALAIAATAVIGCQEPAQHREKADKVAYNIIQHKQLEAMGKVETFLLVRPSDLLRRRLLTDQGLQFPDETSLGSDKLPHIEHWPDPEYLKSSPDNK